MTGYKAKEWFDGSACEQVSAAERKPRRYHGSDVIAVATGTTC